MPVQRAGAVMRLITTLLAVPLLSAPLAAQGATQNATQGATLRGRILDAVSGAPLAGATVAATTTGASSEVRTMSPVTAIP